MVSLLVSFLFYRFRPHQLM